MYFFAEIACRHRWVLYGGASWIPFWIGKGNNNKEDSTVKKIAGMVLGMAMLAGSAGAVPLVYEGFDYAVGSDASTWNGGTGLSSNPWYFSSATAGTTLETNLVEGLSFGEMQVEGGALHIKYNATSGFSNAIFARQMNNAGVNSNDFWMAYLIRFDTANSTTPDDEWLEFRTANLKIRTGMDEAQPRMYLRYGSSTAKTLTPDDARIKDGTTFLYVAKIPDLGLSSTANHGYCWVMDAPGYDSMMANGGISEANLDTYAFGKGDRNPYITDRQAGNVTMQLVPLGRDNSTTSFFIDEWRIGTTAEDVIGAPYPPSGPSRILKWTPLPGNIVQMVVDAPGRTKDYYPKASSDLLSGGWEGVAHSDDGTDPFVITNLDYSTTDASGTNEVIYVQSTDAKKYFRIGGAQ
jgi:hypothetical protein